MSATVTGKTEILGVFGDPVAHTRSPHMHNAAFRALNLDMIYLPFEVTKDDLRDAMKGIRALNFVGVNLTHPHKVAVLDYLDGVDDEAVEIGAVNTVVNKDGSLMGYNTDGAGFMRSLKDNYGIDPKDKRIVVFGAGGAGRAICWALSRERPKRLVIVNRTFEKAEILAQKVRGDALPWNDPHLEDEIEEAHLVVNTTSTSLDLDPAWISEKVFLYDIGYHQAGTSVLQTLRQKGARIGDGLSMLLYQGALAFELWTGERAPLEQMRQALFDRVTEVSASQEV